MSHSRPPVYRLIDISPDLAVLPCLVGAVRRLGEEQCAVYLAGQSAADGGFKVDRTWEDVVGELNDELERAAAEEAGEYDDDDGDDDAKDED